MIYGGVGFHILLIMLGQGDRVDVKVPGRRDPTWQGLVCFTAFGLFYSVPVLRAPPPVVTLPWQGIRGRRTPHAAG